MIQECLATNRAGNGSAPADRNTSASDHLREQARATRQKARAMLALADDLDQAADTINSAPAAVVRILCNSTPVCF